jgi:hypothetical protein
MASFIKKAYLLKDIQVLTVGTEGKIRLKTGKYANSSRSNGHNGPIFGAKNKN